MAGERTTLERTTAETAAGTLAGVRGADAIEFLGIPYARAERFGAPAAATPWTGVRDATEYGPAAPQPDRPAARFTHGPMPAIGEDCLNLNVYTPALDGERPVMVWLHGGGFAIGHAGASLYHGARLATGADAVVVTVNYRLGSLGWLGHPDLAERPGAPAANWGLLDQIAALEWVRENIAAFGGDPGRVTVAGQSAGALCAIDLLVGARSARPVPAGHPAVAAPGRPDPAAGGSRRAGPRRSPKRPAPAIRGRSGQWPQIGSSPLHEELLERPEYRGTRGGALPTLDPASLPTSALEVHGVSPEVEVLAGHTADEGTFFFDSPWRPAPPPERVPDIVAHLCPDEDPGEVLRRYGDDLVAIATEAMVAGPLAVWCQARAAAGPRVYRYRFDHPGGGPRLRATHTAEVPLLFGTWRDGDAGERLGGHATGAGPVADALVRGLALVPAWEGTGLATVDRRWVAARGRRVRWPAPAPLGIRGRRR